MNEPSGVVRAVVLGDLLADVVLAPERPLERGTDVPGRVLLRQGGSAASAARWLSRLGVGTTLICAVGADLTGSTLIRSLERDGVTVQAVRRRAFLTVSRPAGVNVPARLSASRDTTGAGDAFDAGFLAGWLRSGARSRPGERSLATALCAGNRVASRQILAARERFELGGTVER